MDNLIEINGNEKVRFNNNVDFCVGTGRMGLALTKEYFDQLELVQKEIGFKYIRGHGLFCDDMGIFQIFYDKSNLKKEIKDFSSFEEYTEYVESNAAKKIEYNFTYLDRVFDSYLKLNIRPFLELGFMPYKMASGKQTVFYWKGNTTPPSDYKLWTDMVQATLTHLINRYGEEEVLSWPIEVWNEPNLPGFWKDADIDEYFKLYEITSKAIKKVNKKFKVGGPAICGGADEKWMKGFMEFCKENNPPIDFVSRHHYTTEFPEDKGHYGYAKLMKLDDTLDTLKNCKKIIDKYPLCKNLPFYITEFNTSYIPNCPLHDTNLNAAYIARTLSEIGDFVTGYSYWTFGDVFEERGIPFTPFYGGFGLVANGKITKPTFWAFKFFKDIKDCNCVYRNKNCVVVKTKENLYKGILWNLTLETKKQILDFDFSLKIKGKKQRLCLVTKTVDEVNCNPLKIWHDLGEPSSLNKEQLELIKDGAKPFVSTKILKLKDEYAKFTLSALRNSLIYFELKDAELQSDNGYNYNYYDSMSD